MQTFAKCFPRVAAVVESTTAQGLHSGGQIYVSLREEVMISEGFGESRPGVGMDSGSILLWLSSGKPIAAVAIGLLVEAGLLDWDDPVVRHVPEFGARGKEGITVRHLLMHTAGIRWANFRYSMPWEQIIAAICDAPIEPRWIVGETAGYHPLASWYILGEIVRRIDPERRKYEVFAREKIFKPLGMGDCWFTLTTETYRDYGQRIAQMASTVADHAFTMPVDRENQCGLCVPGASGRGPMRELGKFYEMMLRGGRMEDGRRLLRAETVDLLTGRHRKGVYDLTFKHIVDWGLGFIVNSGQYGEQTVPYGFGPWASARAFGHGGSQSSIGMADPEFGLVVGIVFNCLPGEAAHQARMRAMLKAVYEDLGLSAKG